jgi:serine/threonine protein kinase
MSGTATATSTETPGTADAGMIRTSNVRSDATSDAARDIVFEGLQVTFVNYLEDGKQARRAFETVSVSIATHKRHPLYKRLLLKRDNGEEKSVSLLGATAWELSVCSAHPDDVQPSFAKHSVCISAQRGAMMSWVVASPTAEDQRSLIDRLCAAGCIMRDLQDQIAMLPNTEHPSEVLRLGRPSLSRRNPSADVVALKLAVGEDNKKQMLNEVQILMNLHHNRIVTAYGVYEVTFKGKESFGLIIDYKSGLDLSAWIPTGGLPERMVRGMFSDICDALVYLHDILIVHRDIKLSNVLCSPAENGLVSVFLADFGLSSHALDKEKLSTRCGTVGYIAPEIFRQDWAVQLEEASVASIAKVDTFSFGIMIYAAVFGKNPFVDANDPTEGTTRLRNARGLVSLANMGGRSDELQSLLSGLCRKDIRERLSSSEAFVHPWLSFHRGGSRSRDAGQNVDVTWKTFKRVTELEGDP